MALLTSTDLERQANITLTATGLDLANALIPAVEQWASTRLGYPLELGSRTDYFDGGRGLYFLATSAPVDPASVSVALYNLSTGAYDAYIGKVRASADGRVWLSSRPYSLPEGVRITYAAGWTSATLPRDLKQALVKLLTREFLASLQSSPPDQAAQPVLKRVTAGAYTEEYAASSGSTSVGTNIPNDIQEVFDRYVRPFAL